MKTLKELSKDFHGNSMTLPIPVIPDNSLKTVICTECGEINKVDLTSWTEAEDWICDACKLEIKND